MSLKRLETELQHLAGHDPLTGLLNRRGFGQALSGHAAHVDRYGPGGALLVLDLDGLKAVNDTCGHEAGDQAIATIANILRRRLRSTDTTARLGGDEYAVILARADRRQAGRVAAMLVTAIRLGSAIDEAAPDLTASIGVALFDMPGKTAHEVLAQADRSMYAKKNAGGNGFTIFRQAWDRAAAQPEAASQSSSYRPNAVGLQSPSAGPVVTRPVLTVNL